eukprot:1272164-Amphidinium_carterae.1
MHLHEAIVKFKAVLFVSSNEVSAEDAQRVKVLKLKARVTKCSGCLLYQLCNPSHSKAQLREAVQLELKELKSFLAKCKEKEKDLIFAPLWAKVEEVLKHLGDYGSCIYFQAQTGECEFLASGIGVVLLACIARAARKTY